MAMEKDTVKRLEGQGIGGITPDIGVSALSSLMSHKAGLAQAAVMPVSWSKFAARSGGRLPPFFSRVARTDMSAVGGTSGGSGGALEMLQSIAASDRLLYLQELVLETAREAWTLWLRWSCAILCRLGCTVCSCLRRCFWTTPR
ncbi:hypothetical protein Naga_102879g1 [Nannochloropsis gaditana]|uniref:Uncharacterized protein n=1 Tax=Nannochloropsis gaditana TaxID=72520 RepID=W7TG54_9STRA|nr:hypothetical protein Naga_102879g1 [Nannochloropsis gaditana]